MAAFEGIIHQKWGVRHCSKAHIDRTKRERHVILDRIREFIRLRSEGAFHFHAAPYSDASRSSNYMRVYGQDHFEQM